MRRFSNDIRHAKLTTIITTALEIRPYTHLCRENQASRETRVLFENKNALIYGACGSISGAVFRTFANATSGTFTSHMPLASMTTQH